MEHETENKKQSSPRDSAPSRVVTHAFTAPPLHPLLQLQQQAGNQAVQTLLRSNGIHPKLALSHPDDPEEREADEVAGKIMRAHAGFPASSAAPCSCSGGEDMCNECQQKQSQPTIHRSATSPGTLLPHSASSLEHPAQISRIVTDALRSPGHPLDSSTRAFFEPRFNRDLRHVRIHTSPEAAASARAISAHAYTLGSHVAFAAGQYSPNTTPGRTLLAHELTHVAQNRKAESTFVSDSNPRLEVSANSGDKISRQADQSQTLVDQVQQALSAPDPVAGVGNPAAAFQILAGISSEQLLLQVLTELGRRAQLDILISNVGSAPPNSEALLTSLFAVKVATGGATDISDPYLIEAAKHISKVPDETRDAVVRHVITLRYGAQNLAATMEALPALLESLSNTAGVPEAALQIAGAASAGLPQPGPWQPPGGQPIPYYIGNQAHVGIAAEYALFHSADVAFYNFTPMSTLLTRWTNMGNKLTGVLEAGKEGLKPDIINLTKKHLYEIKPFNSLPLAVAEAAMYAALFTAVGVPMTLGPIGEPGTTGIVPAPAGLFIFTTPAPGAITYQYRRAELRRVQVEEPSGERKWRVELRPLTQQQQAAIATTTVGGMMLIIIMIALSPVAG
jgi:hypothetical protein